MIAEIFKCDLCGHETNDIEFFQKHPEECEYVAVECDNQCGLKLYRCKINEHKEVECLVRNIKCEYCQENYIAHSMTDHFKKCPKMMIECPNECDAFSIMREQLDEHLKTDCSVNIGPCDFQYAQCQFKGTRDSLVIHLKESGEHHLQLLGSKVMQLTQQLQQTVIKLEETQKNLEDNVLNLKTQTRTCQEQCKQNTFKLKLTENKLSVLENNVTILNSSNAPFIWRINNWTKQRSFLFSSIFYTKQNGYKIQAIINPTEQGKSFRKDNVKHVSLFVRVLTGEYDPILSWPFRYKVIITLLNQTGGANYTKILNTAEPNLEVWRSKNCFERPQEFYYFEFGYGYFITQTKIKNFIKDDTLYIKFEFEDI